MLVKPPDERKGSFADNFSESIGLFDLKIKLPVSRIFPPVFGDDYFGFSACLFETPIHLSSEGLERAGAATMTDGFQGAFTIHDGATGQHMNR